MTTQIVERSGARIALPEGKGDKYKVRMMGWTPGSDTVEGSSADYPVAVIKRDFAEAFPVGTRIRANHDGFCEAGGDIRRIIAKTVDSPWPEEDGMYTNVRFSEQWSPFVEEFGDVVGLSISAAGEYQMVENEDGDLEIVRNEETGNPIIKRFLSQEESPYNSLDMVEAPGADGRVVARALESAKTSFEHLNVREQATFAKDTLREKTSTTVPSRNDEKKGNSMDHEEIEALVEQAATAAATRAVEALRPSEPIAQENAVKDVAEALITAGLSEEGRAAVYERMELGQSAQDAIARESAREKSIQEQLNTRNAANAVEQSGYTTPFDAHQSTSVPAGVVEMSGADLDKYLGV